MSRFNTPQKAILTIAIILQTAVVWDGATGSISRAIDPGNENASVFVGSMHWEVTSSFPGYPSWIKDQTEAERLWQSKIQQRIELNESIKKGRLEQTAWRILGYTTGNVIVATLLLLVWRPRGTEVA